MEKRIAMKTWPSVRSVHLLWLEPKSANGRMKPDGHEVCKRFIVVCWAIDRGALRLPFALHLVVKAEDIAQQASVNQQEYRRSKSGRDQHSSLVRQQRFH